ncbi:MAG: M23 family metallopeptidase, partial [Anaerolineales bacterium]|nr:M23 family metallopeptidase [Anaerolineales bacterium]
EPLIPADIVQPKMQLPFDNGVAWAFTGGPHGGWDAGSAWGALDFGPLGTVGCAPSLDWAAAVADGLIVRAFNGAVIQDLDNDGFEQTGWTVLYMHIDSYERVESGMYLFAGEHVGHVSCEGGVSNATHLHVARKYNGEWIAADGSLPFILDGWVSSGSGDEYDGFLTRGSQIIEAWDGVNDLNQITR